MEKRSVTAATMNRSGTSERGDGKRRLVKLFDLAAATPTLPAKRGAKTENPLLRLASSPAPTFLPQGKSGGYGFPRSNDREEEREPLSLGFPYERRNESNAFFFPSTLCRK